MTCLLSLMGFKAANRNRTLLQYLEDVQGLPLLSTTTARHLSKSSPFIGESSSTSTLSTIFEGAPGITSSERLFSTMEPSFVLTTTSYEPALDRDGPSNENAFRAPLFTSSNANSSSAASSTILRSLSWPSRRFSTTRKPLLCRGALVSSSTTLVTILAASDPSNTLP